jgi:hypothetical protein
MDSFNIYRYDPIEQVDGITPILVMATNSEKANGFLTDMLCKCGWDGQASFMLVEVKQVTEGMYLILK